MAVKQDTKFIDAIDKFVLVKHVLRCLVAAAVAKQFVERKHCVIARVIGVMTCGSVDNLTVLVAH